MNPLSKTQKNLPFGENWERFYARWREPAREIPGARIQEWLGHSDFSTTANIYAHLDYASKLSSAQAMLEGLGYGNASA